MGNADTALLGAREVLGHERRRLLAAFEAPAAEALGRLGHVVAPLGLVQLHLLLAVRQEGQVGERLLLAQVRGQRPSALHAAGLEDLQLGRRLGRRHAAGALGAAALLHHGLVAAVARRRRLLLVAPQRLLGPFVAAQLRVALQPPDVVAVAAAAAAAKHLLPARREETI
uniref:Uncharacterized protein n=1 Tax=Podarcis muralis TaxID=64176 RepID=A0A670I0D9_PODMU